MKLGMKRKGRHRREEQQARGQGYGPPIPGRILGWDDWLVLARRDDGTLVYRGFEYDPRWLTAPHEGDALYGSPEWRIDNAYMLHRIKAEDAADLSGWALAEALHVSDDAFAEGSAKVYLPARKELELNRIRQQNRTTGQTNIT